MATERFGTLFLVPAPLDFGCETKVPLQDVMPQRTLLVAAGLSHWICENAKSTRAYLKRIGEVHPLAVSLQDQQIAELPHQVHKKGDHSNEFDARPLLQPAVAGHDIGLVSEAGMPAIADPGSSVVRSAHDLRLKVVPLVGPASLVLALAASGLNGQNFAFVGYLPQDAALRTRRIRELEALALKSGQSQLFIETPYRNATLWSALLDSLQPSTRLAVAGQLTLPDALTRSGLVRQWKDQPAPVTNDKPAVFAIGR